MSAPRRSDPGQAGARWSRWIVGPLVRLVWDVRVVGAQRVPASGPVLLAANHLGVLDGPLMHAAAPRPSHLLVKEEMFRGLLGFALRTAGQLRVDRESGRSGLESARAVLKRGGVVGIFPEGNRGRGDAASVRAGVGWLAVHADAPVVPVALLGTRRTGESVGRLPGLRRRLVVEFGEPVLAQRGASARESVQLTAEVVGLALVAHVSAAADRHGVTLPVDGTAVVR